MVYHPLLSFNLMNILAHIPKYKGTHNSGGESYIHDMLKGLQEFHDVRALTESDSYRIDGIEVFEKSKTDIMYRWADLVISHLQFSGLAHNKCERYKKPLIHVIHSTHRKATIKKHHGVIYNSNYSKSAFTHPGYVFNPPTSYEDYKTDTYGDAITLVNCNKNKGGDFLIELAKSNRHLNFIGVKGSYGDQVIAEEPNIKYYDNTDKIKSVLSETRVLLMPSEYESYGKVGVEAMCSGIPVIASDLEGIREALGDAGIYCNRNVEKYSNAINYVLEDYEYLSGRCVEHAKSKKPDFIELNQYIKDYVKSYDKSQKAVL